VVHATRRHRAQGGRRHPYLLATQQKLDRRRGRELRRPTEAAVVRVERLAQDVDGGVEALRIDLALSRREQRATLQPAGDAIAARADLVAPLVPRVGDGLEDAPPA